VKRGLSRLLTNLTQIITKYVIGAVLQTFFRIAPTSSNKLLRWAASVTMLVFLIPTFLDLD
jgi:ABC-type amino acid transport system permease subunit